MPHELIFKLVSRLSHLRQRLSEIVMDDYDAGLREAACGEIKFLEGLIKEYGESEERTSDSRS